MKLRSKRKRSHNNNNDHNDHEEEQQEQDVKSSTPTDMITLHPVKTWSGWIKYLLGYSGPPGSKNTKAIIQNSRMIKNMTELDEVCDNLITYYYEGVRGPAGKVKYIPDLQKWRDSVDESIWEDHFMIIMIHEHRCPHLESITINSTSSELSVVYSIDKRAGQKESHIGLFEAVLVAYSTQANHCNNISVTNFTIA